MVSLRLTCLIDDGHEGHIDKFEHECRNFGEAFALATEIEKGVKEMLECHITLKQ